MNNKINNLREFGKFRLDAEKRVLWCDDKPVSLPLKEIELLCVLTENGGEVVTKDELLNRVWADAFVEESNLSRHIYMLRKTFKDFGESEELIQTVPRRGYRFTGEVREIENGNGKIVIERRALTRTLIEDVSENSGLEKSETDQISFRRSKTFSLPVLAATVLLVVLVGGLAVWSYQNSPPRTSTSPEIKSIAVLPLKSFAQNNDEELRLRITDALITRLGSNDRIIVRPTSAVLRFAGQETGALEAGRKLAVDSILEGRVQQEGERVRVTLQMISVNSGEQIWSEQFDGNANQILSLQDAIAAKLSQTLGAKAQKSLQLASRPTGNNEAYEAFLKGRFHWNKRSGDSLYKAVGHFEQAVALDPQFAEAYAALADTQYLLYDYNFEVSAEQVARARENLHRALKIKPELHEALTTLGTMQMNYDWDWASAASSLKQAAEIAPNSPTTRIRYGAFLLRMGRFNEAQTEFERAIELDPLSIIANSNLGIVYYCKKDFAAAERQYRKTFEIDDRFGSTHWLLSRSLWQENKKTESLAEIARGLELDGNAPLARRIEAKAQSSTPEEAIRLLLDEWRDNPRGTNPHNLAYLSTYLNDRENALTWLEKSFAEHHPWTVWIKAAPEFQTLRGEPRFEELLRKMNLQ